MNEILRKRLLRKLDTLPDAQLYQVLDYIEFLESKYATAKAPDPGGLQRFAERMEDRLRARSVLPEVMSGTMKVFGTAGRLLDGISEAGRGIVEGVETGLRAPPAAPPPSTAARPPEAAGEEPTPDAPRPRESGDDDIARA
ncbi:MAG TPA: DUF2281 domain-containing protein [Longimicrobiales bacterium]|nr:DUF2281 domain-containing protein [Longimicrobiales bacterium]